MIRKKIVVLAGVILTIWILPSVERIAFAQYINPDSQNALEDYFILAQGRVTVANDNPKADFFSIF